LTVTHHKESNCPACGHPINAAGTIDSNDTYVAEPGDITVCFGCACVLVYADDMSVRMPTTKEITEMPPEQLAELEDLQRKIKLLNEIFPGKTEPPPPG